MSQLQLKNGQAFLCTKTVLYGTGDPLKKGQQSFTQGTLYFVSLLHYLTDNRGIHKNYAWFKDDFERSVENDKVIVKKPFSKKKKQTEV